MSTLVIHPKDRTTDFLKPIYKDLADKTVIRGNVDKFEVEMLIDAHDQVMMMGHGSPHGLLSVGQFNNTHYAISDWHSDVLSEKDNSVFIWCNADQFVDYHALEGFYTGMFISDVWEAAMMGVRGVKPCHVDESNRTFVNAIKGHKTTRMMHAAANHKYGKLARSNKVARYNHDRLYLAA